MDPSVDPLTIKFPNESSEYRSARLELLKAELDLKHQVERVAAMRRALPLGGEPKKDYVFDEMTADGGTGQVKLSELFSAGKTSLFLYSFMFGPNMENACPMCSSFLDAINGNAAHLAQRINLGVVARSPIERVAAYARQRGWNNLRMLSSANNSYHPDTFSENAEGGQMPMANVWVKRDGVVRHFWGSELLYAGDGGDPRHVDLMWPLWNVLDTTPEGRGEWYPPLTV